MTDIDDNLDTDPAAPIELPLFPAQAPDALGDPAATLALLRPVLGRLAELIDPPEDLLTAPTPCRGLDVAGLRDHVLAWLRFFAAAASDPDGRRRRPETDGWTLDPADDPGHLVRQAAADLEQAIRQGVMDRVVVMSQARMQGGAVVAMALGEYVVHAWDLAVSTGRSYEAPAGAAAPALAFLRTTVAPEYRGPDSGFFDEEVPAPADADDLVRLLCFTGRNPAWRP